MSLNCVVSLLGKLSTSVLSVPSTWSYRLHVKLTKSVRKRIQKNKDKNATVRKYIDGRGKSRVCQT